MGKRQMKPPISVLLGDLALIGSHVATRQDGRHMSRP
jgi:hypothetical protein